MSLESSQQHMQTFFTINQNQVNLQMANVQQQSNSSPRSNHIPHVIIESSSDSDDSTPLAQLIGAKKCLTPEPVELPAPKVTKKPKGQKKKKDPNEPQKPVSAYALFFRDTQAAIKARSPNASFGEVSKIVASMWDSLDVDRKNSYKKRSETAKKEHLKALATYRANLVSKAAVDQSDSMYGNSSPPISTLPYSSPSGHMISIPKQPTPILEAIQPVNSNQNVHPQQNQQMWYMQSPPQMNNSSPSHVMHGGNGIINMGVMSQQQQVPQMNMNSSPPMCNSTLSSPTYNQSMTSMPPGSYPNMMNAYMMGSFPTCLRDGCTNFAIDSPDWDLEYCSNECVVLHCKDVFATWIAQRQLNPNQFSTVK